MGTLPICVLLHINPALIIVNQAPHPEISKLLASEKLYI